MPCVLTRKAVCAWGGPRGGTAEPRSALIAAGVIPGTFQEQTSQRCRRPGWRNTAGGASAGPERANGRCLTGQLIAVCAGPQIWSRHPLGRRMQGTDGDGLPRCGPCVVLACVPACPSLAVGGAGAWASGRRGEWKGLGLVWWVALAPGANHLGRWKWVGGVPGGGRVTRTRRGERGETHARRTGKTPRSWVPGWYQRDCGANLRPDKKELGRLASLFLPSPPLLLVHHLHLHSTHTLLPCC